MTWVLAVLGGSVVFLGLAFLGTSLHLSALQRDIEDLREQVEAMKEQP